MAGRNHKNDSEKIFWISFADLNTSLMLCFMAVFLGVTYLSAAERLKSTQKIDSLEKDEKIRFDIAEAIKPVVGAKKNINEALSRAESKIKQIIDTNCDGVADIKLNPDDLSLTIEFGKQNISWFDPGSATPKEAGNECLKAFVPMWLGEMYKLSESSRRYIDQLVIEGHTDSSGFESTDPFLGNLKLSQDRSLAVAKFVLDTKSGITGSDYRDYPEVTKEWLSFSTWLKERLTATGRSYSKLIKKNNTEDAEKSRRVEFKIVLMDQLTVIEKIISNGDGKMSTNPRSTASEASK